MNNLLQLKKEFDQQKGAGLFGGPKFPTGERISIDDFERTVEQFEYVLEYWRRQHSQFARCLVEIEYKEIVAKSNRIKRIFSNNIKGKQNDSELVVGAKFADDKERHVITYFLDDIKILEKTTENLRLVISKAREIFGEEITEESFEALDRKKAIFGDKSMTNLNFLQIVADLARIRKVGYPDNKVSGKDGDIVIVSIFDANVSVKAVLRELNILPAEDYIDDTTVALYYADAQVLKNEVPYLVSMSTKNIMDLRREYADRLDENGMFTMREPRDEPVVGVIDTAFDEGVYFSGWVEHRNMIDSALELDDEDFMHGTEVDSIIVDGPALNPGLDDGCGNFRVRHFTIGKSNAISVTWLCKKIQTIVNDNRDIKVWNLSLGSKSEVNDNCISPVAAILDKIQFENPEIVFVVAGTNKENNSDEVVRVGSPADSINSLVVNSVKANMEPAAYTREGPVLSFFNKPDVAYYGGDRGEEMIACGHNGIYSVYGTSFAAPWITRKMAYLMEIIGLSRELAKALIIDSAGGWTDKYKQPGIASKVGFGVVPQRIEDILKSSKDEIRFVISETSKEYDTCTYTLPVPTYNNEFPYIARATLCYCPNCDRNQGVDYTDTEMDLYFGRVDNKGHIKAINENRQSLHYDELPGYIKEKKARQLFRKWDNVKHIQEYEKQRARGKKTYMAPLWGISVKTKERSEKKHGQGLKFGIVITLKEIHGINRINEFIRLCNLRGWIVEKIDIDNKLDVYNKLQETIDILD